MSESVLGGMLGDEDEQLELEQLENEVSADAFAATIAHQAAQNNPDVALKAAAFLDSQKHMVDVQTVHMKDEHQLRLAHLKNQLREEGLRRFAKRLHLSFQLILALFTFSIALYIALMVRDAVNSHSVVIDLFETPPALAQSGISGKTVAAGLLDVLTKIQTATRANAERRSLSNAWTNEIAIQIPETGVSIGQIQRAIENRYGHDQHITGELVQTANGGLALTVRGNGIPPKSFPGTASEMDKLLTEAGEYVYSQSQPGLWTAYLSTSNRTNEAIKFAKSTYARVPDNERVYVLNYWANAIVNQGGGVTALREALPLWRETIRLKPDYWIGYNNIMYALNAMGDEEGEVHVGEQLKVAAGGRPGRAPENSFQNYDSTVWDLQTQRADIIAGMESNGGLGSSASTAETDSLEVIQTDVLLHDPYAAELRLKTTPFDPKSLIDVSNVDTVRAMIAEERGEIKTAATEWDKYAVTYADSTVSTPNPSGLCFAAVSYEKTGQSKKADAALNSATPLTFVDCYRFHGDVLDLRGNWPEAQQWYAKAIKLGPSIPSGYYSWGMALMRHGDLAGATIQFATANQKGPHWADPLKAWGDVLQKQGKTQEAEEKYTEALKYAPNWKELKEAIKLGTTH